MKKAIIIAAISLFLFSCKKENTTVTVNRLAFGVSYGFCVGNCAKFFLLNNDNLFADSMDRFTTPLLFKNTALAQDKYNLAKELLTTFPKYLTLHSNETFGCPDCVDQGAIYIEATINGTTSYWKIDTDTGKQPDAVKAYINNLTTIVSQL